MQVKLYSLLRKAVGAGSITFKLSGDSVRVGDIVDLLMEEYPGARKLGFSPVVLDSNGSRLSSEDRISCGATIHVMPPPSGGAARVFVELVGPDEPEGHVIERVLSFLRSNAGDDTGAVLIFIGLVRRRNLGRNVKALEYESAGDLSLRVFEKIASDILAMEGVRAVAGVHYTGRRMPGSVTMVLGVAGVSRTHVIDALRVFIDRVKHELPVWKREYTEEGSYYILGGDTLEVDED